MKISKRTVDSAQPTRKNRFLWDDELKGFGLRVAPNGRKGYVLQYRLNGRQRRYKIGDHGALAPAEARKMAKELLGRIARGEDPAAERYEKRRELTVAELCDLYLVEGCSHKKESTLKTDRGTIKRHIKPCLGNMKVGAVRRSDVQKFMQQVAEGRTKKTVKTKARGLARVRGGEGIANRAVGLLGGIFTFAVERELIDINPAHKIKKYPTKNMVRHFDADEIKRLSRALSESTEDKAAIVAIRLLYLTGCRKGEILELKWDQVDFMAPCLVLPDSKTGYKTVPLGSKATEMLESWRVVSKPDDNPYVIPGVNGQHFIGLQKVWERVRKQTPVSNVRAQWLSQFNFLKARKLASNLLPNANRATRDIC